MRTIARIRSVAVLTALAACGHGEPFSTPPFGTTQPFLPGSPTRLTYNTWSDSEASWLPDGSALLYTATRADQPDSAGCVEFLPPTGGRSTRSICPGLAPVDSVRAVQAAAASPGGRLAFLLSAHGDLDLGWSRRDLVLTTLDPRAPWRVLQHLPFPSSIPMHNGVSQIRWLSEGRFVYRADDFTVLTCRGCTPVGASTGLFVVLVDLQTDPATFALVPGTTDARGLVASGDDAILFTVAGDPRVFREVLSTGVVSVFWNYGAGNTVDAIQVAGNRLVALVNGVPMLTDLTAGTSTVIDGQPYSGPALSPDGRQLVLGQSGDLWLFTLP